MMISVLEVLQLFFQLYSMYSSNFEAAQMEYSRLLRKYKAFKELVQIIEVWKVQCTLACTHKHMYIL